MRSKRPSTGGSRTISRCWRRTRFRNRSTTHPPSWAPCPTRIFRRTAAIMAPSTRFQATICGTASPPRTCTTCPVAPGGPGIRNCAALQLPKPASRSHRYCAPTTATLETPAASSAQIARTCCVIRASITRHPGAGSTPPRSPLRYPTISARRSLQPVQSREFRFAATVRGRSHDLRQNFFLQGATPDPVRAAFRVLKRVARTARSCRSTLRQPSRRRPLE